MSYLSLLFLGPPMLFSPEKTSSVGFRPFFFLSCGYTDDRLSNPSVFDLPYLICVSFRVPLPLLSSWLRGLVFILHRLGCIVSKAGLLMYCNNRVSLPCASGRASCGQVVDGIKIAYAHYVHKPKKTSEIPTINLAPVATLST